MLFLILILLFIAAVSAQDTISKRGLIYIPSQDPNDFSVYTHSGSDLAWYYNYGYYPTQGGPALPFVPMVNTLPESSDDFTSAISSLLKSSSPPTHLLTFNEPDMPTDVGGSDISPSNAAKFYISTILPLRKHVQISFPSTSGSGIGLNWLAQFNKSCHKINPKHGCPADFLATHWYGDFAGMASWLGQLHSLYPNLPIWVTEFADPSVTLEDTQAFFNESTSYLRNLKYVDYYAWFGSFRSSAANGFVGPNVSFLDDGGQLTDIGSWYLGGKATGNLPSAGLGNRVQSPWAISLIPTVVILLTLLE